MNSLIQRMSNISVSRARSCLSTVAGVTNRQATLAAQTTTNRQWQHLSVAMATSQWSGKRCFSTENASTASPPKITPNTAQVFTDQDSGEHYGMILDTRQLPKLKPSIVKRRLSKCKTYVGTEKAIRQSPWKLNRVCQLAAGLTLEEALTQLQFCDVKNSDLIAKVLRRTSNLADIRDGLQMSQLEVAECFTTKSMMLKRIKPMGRGR